MLLAVNLEKQVLPTGKNRIPERPMEVVLQLFLVAIGTTKERLPTLVSLVSGGQLQRTIQQLHGAVQWDALALMFSGSSALRRTVILYVVLGIKINQVMDVI
jgi:hypothetical protein